MLEPVDYGFLWGISEKTQAAVAMSILFPRLHPLLGSPEEWKNVHVWTNLLWSVDSPKAKAELDAVPPLGSSATLCQRAQHRWMQAFKAGGYHEPAHPFGGMSPVAPGIYVSNFSLKPSSSSRACRFTM